MVFNCTITAQAATNHHWSYGMASQTRVSAGHIPHRRGGEPPDTNYDTKTHAADLAGLIRALDLQKPSVMGHSMGAGIAATLAAAYPDLPACIILEDPPWRPALLGRSEAEQQ